MRRKKIAGYVNIFGTSFRDDEIERIFDNAKKLKKTRLEYEEFLNNAIFSFAFGKYSIAVFIEGGEKKITVAKALKWEVLVVVDFRYIDEILEVYRALSPEKVELNNPRNYSGELRSKSMSYEEAKEKAKEKRFGETAISILRATSFGPVNPYRYFGTSLRRNYSYAYFTRLEKAGLIKKTTPPEGARGYRYYTLA
jgi:hypothetical protein